MVMKRAFLVGCCTRRSTTVLVLRRITAPLRGPWMLRAVVSPN